MFGIPYRHLTIESPFNPHKISKHLEGIVWRHSLYWFGGLPKDKQFVGFFSPERFRLQRIAGFSTLFKPILYGTVSSNQSGSEIKIIITLAPMELIAVSVLNLGLIFAAIASLIVPLILFALALLLAFDLLGYLLFFVPEARFLENWLLQEFKS